MSFENLPDLPLIKILSYLDLPHLVGQCALVNKRTAACCEAIFRKQDTLTLNIGSVARELAATSPFRFLHESHLTESMASDGAIPKIVHSPFQKRKIVINIDENDEETLKNIVKMFPNIRRLELNGDVCASHMVRGYSEKLTHLKICNLMGYDPAFLFEYKLPELKHLTLESVFSPLFSSHATTLIAQILGRLHEFYLHSGDNFEDIASALNHLGQNEALKKCVFVPSMNDIRGEALQQLNRDACKRISYLGMCIPQSDIKEFSCRFTSLTKIQILAKFVAHFLPHLASFSRLSHVEVMAISLLDMAEQQGAFPLREDIPPSASIRLLQLNSESRNSWTDVFLGWELPSLLRATPRLQAIRVTAKRGEKNDLVNSMLDHFIPMNMRQQCLEFHRLEYEILGGSSIRGFVNIED